jgi:predicted AlkP superfamily pyrophosphatase or phosphodiesterase
MRLIPRLSLLLLLITLSTLIACKKLVGDVVPVTAVDKQTNATIVSTKISYKTQNVIIIVVDGARYSETFGDPTHQNIPNLHAMQSQGVVLSNFTNMGFTYTDPGHAAICTGYYENLDNTGQDLPQYPSIFQTWLKSSGKSADKAWIITSKDKLQILANCKQADWNNQYMPRTDCGINGLGTGYRSDDTTFVHAKNVLKKHQPNLMLINFKDPDYFGHGNEWKNYIKGIKSTDNYIKQLYDLIQSDDNYKDKTTIIVTNDHGRHTDGHLDGFISHGDNCPDCRHIEFLAIGPDFKTGVTLQTTYNQIDISQTVAKLLNFRMNYSTGTAMTELFK